MAGWLGGQHIRPTGSVFPLTSDIDRQSLSSGFSTMPSFQKWKVGQPPLRLSEISPQLTRTILMGLWHWPQRVTVPCILQASRHHVRAESAGRAGSLVIGWAVSALTCL